MSLVKVQGEWLEKHISIIGAAKSFIGQLRFGQDMTKVSMPSMFLRPYSFLELIGYRAARCAAVDSRRLKSTPDPVDRMVNMIRMYLNGLDHEEFEKKPYNPVLGEVHRCWTVNSDAGRVTYVGEQVSHHPPVSAWALICHDSGVRQMATLGFSVKFHGNSASITTKGVVEVEIVDLGEVYTFSKALPNVAVKNVIFGTKHVYWNDTVKVHCKKTGLSALLKFKAKGSRNACSATVTTASKEVMYKLSGTTGGRVYVFPAKSKKERVLLTSPTLRKEDPILYVAPAKDDALDSFSIWLDVTKEICADNLDAADEAKRLVEQGQRERHAAKVESGQEHVAQFFKLNTETNVWEFRDEKLKDLSYEEALANADEDSMTPAAAIGVSLPTAETMTAVPSSAAGAEGVASTSGTGDPSATGDGERTTRHARRDTFKKLQKKDDGSGVEESEDESTASYSTTATITDDISEPSSDEEADTEGSEEGCVIA
mmetsp:Transcript_42083/g.106170  ORF Transcript_42083/g.106170 Transcript_42083/m.106170 type:complete len:485 (-) Transcript_42083:30-1484(-)|eukprot:CAMPEP_0174239266 /NCGR_PEP_ID=MMETSP0417-20130205/14038_1 /TAXON_ID=242541 /ORGANISM="Mayorella sp, Strain BSH-02190019" /LENGTH=484 /DNA_ID=CAMNT_0015318193 /DNA_START=104 /DNA_END=1558 /DNA_ORIENTATION=+